MFLPRLLISLVGLVAFLFSVLATADLLQDIQETDLPRSEIYSVEQTPTGKGLEFSVVVFRDIGWGLDTVTNAIKQAAQIYASECDFYFTVNEIRMGGVANRFHNLTEPMQQELIESLNLPRPIVFFINTTTDNDYAYSYQQGTVSPSQGTVWMTRRVVPACHGPLLAHELGHIALDVAEHSNAPKNLMGFTCYSSNVQNFAGNTKLTRRQCQRLHQRYPD